MAACASFFLTGEGKYRTLVKEVSYRIGDEKGVSAEKLLADSTGWVSQADQPFRATGEPLVAWARFELGPPDSRGRVMIATLPWDSADYFIFREGRLVDRQKAGLLVPWAERTTHVTMTPPIMHAGFVAVDVPAGPPTTVLVRLETHNDYGTLERLRFSLWHAEQVLLGEQRDRILQGVFYGVMLFLVVYNFGLWLVTREPSYVYYVIMELGFTVAWSVIFGSSFEFLWPQHPWWDYRALWAATITGGFGIAQFLRYYLDVRNYSPRVDTFLKWCAYYNVATLPLVAILPMRFDVIGPLLVYSGPLGAAVILGVIIQALVRRHPLAPNLLLAMLCLCIGLVVYFGTELDFFPTTEITIHAAQIGSMLAGVVLSLGLGLRMQNLRAQLADRQLQEERVRGAHEREKRELIEEQNRTLEGKVVERTTELTVAREKSDALLSNILPQAIIEELRATGETEPRRHEEASILFTDFSGFTQAVATMPPRRLVQELNEIFRGFDDIVAGYGLEKIKTIGDAYMAAGGLPVAAEDHAVRCVRAAMALARFIEARNASSAMKWGLRVGVHSGAVVAGIVGKNKYAYDVWGDTVNIASRLESSGEVNRVNISAYTFELVRDHFECEYRGKIAAKGKGDIDMYFVLRERMAEAAPAE